MWRPLSLILFVLSFSLVRADLNSLPVGETIKDFVLPQRNEQGEMQANISGATATAVSVNRTTITQLKIELYDGKTVGTIITSPKSDLWVNENRLTTQDGVVVQSGDTTISSKSMEWDLKSQRGVLRQNVRVIINNFSFDAPAPAPSSP